jgi:phosphoribosylanthranilate isomerase
MNLKLKICGMKYPDNIREVIKFRPDYLGFIFYPGSPRYAGGNIEELSKMNIPSSVSRIGVFVNERTNKIKQIAPSISLDMVQLHGKEPVADCIELKKSGLKVIKVFSVGEDFDFSQMEPYIDHVDYFLFDAKGKYHGGNSLPFDWEIIEKYPFRIPFFLGGGVGLENIDLIKKIRNPYLYALDANSRLEVSPGLKDPDKVKLFRTKFDKL